MFSFSVWLMLLYVHLTSAWTVQTRKITLYLCSVVKPHIPTKWSNITKLFILKPLEKFNSLELWQLTLTKTNPFVIFSFVQRRRTISIILENILNLVLFFLWGLDNNDKYDMSNVYNQMQHNLIIKKLFAF